MSGSGLWQGVHVSMIDHNDEQVYQTSPLGRVMGFGTSNGQPVVLVQLDSPVWTEGRQHFISVLMVHESNLTPTRVYDAYGDPLPSPTDEDYLTPAARFEGAGTIENGRVQIQSWGYDM